MLSRTSRFVPLSFAVVVTAFSPVQAEINLWTADIGVQPTLTFNIGLREETPPTAATTEISLAAATDFAISASEQGLQHSNDSGWDFLWDNNTCIPITAIPEPATGGLIVLGMFVLERRWHKRHCSARRRI